MSNNPCTDIGWNMATDGRFILQSTIVGGIGASAIGADRGEIGPSLLCRAESVGNRVVVTAMNTEFGSGADAASPREQPDPSFAESVLARCGPVPHDSFDASDLGLADIIGIARRLSNEKNVDYTLNRELSFVRSAKRFGPVLAIEAVLSFTPYRLKPALRPPNDGAPPEPLTVLGSPAPTDTVSVIQQIALWPLPSRGYKPLEFDGTIGAMPGLVIHRFDAIGSQDARIPLATRFRLDQNEDPPHPIVFYLDPAMPNEIRAAVNEGGNWWCDAFAAAGFPGSYRVEELPDGVDLLDPRINVVLWTHRADRGWSYGMTQIDPRTGEILRGIVRLGSQRVEQVRTLAEGVLSPYSTNRIDEVRTTVHRRLRQLAAHEIGHALGLAHNFASHHHPRPSVMDYPAPEFTLDGDRISADASYSTGVGPWDVRQIAALYGPIGQPHDRDGPELLYITDADSRHDDASDASAATWIVARQPLKALRTVLDVRRVALEGFGPGVAPPGRDGSEMERRFALVYLLHRFQTVAVAKSIGGSRRHYAKTADDPFDGAQSVVPIAEQRVALEELRRLLTPDFIAIPPRIRSMLVAPAGGQTARPGSFIDPRTHTFDSVAALTAASDLVAGLLVAPRRLNRVHSQFLDAVGISLSEVVDATLGIAIELLEAPAQSEASEVLGWTVMRRFEETLRSPDLHAHVRIAIIEAVDALPLADRASVAVGIESLKEARPKENVPLPMLPAGAPL